MKADSARFRLRGVSVAYDGRGPALDGVDLAIGSGEMVGFVGPSGAGKTTLMRLLNGTLRPTEGSVEVGGEDLRDLSLSRLRRVRSRIGTVHQDLSLVPNLRVLQNVVAGGIGRTSLLGATRLLFLPPRAEVRRAYELLDRVGIPEKLYDRTDRLSGGEQQRVAIARALFPEPAALLADEPVSSVDPARARDTIGLLVELSRERGLTLCVSLHNLELAREFLPRLIGLRDGAVAFDRSTAELEDGDFNALYELVPGNSHAG
jgi:phosphonate transport system ATP-binding protein